MTIRTGALNAEFDLCATQLKSCNRAKFVINTVTMWPEPVDIVRGDSEFCFQGQPDFQDAMNIYATHTVKWQPNVDDRIVVFERTRYFDPNRDTVQPIVAYGNQTYPPMIALLHELGHVWQYIQNPTQYRTLALNGQIAAIERQNLQRNEHPVVDHFELPRRQAYNHTARHSAAVRRQFSDAGWYPMYRTTYERKRRRRELQPLPPGGAVPAGPVF
ncbi:MAG: hypothetical protein ABFS86_17380 [Planctomycetota bacterium]